LKADRLQCAYKVKIDQVSNTITTTTTMTLKPCEAKVVWTRGTDNRLVLKEHRERAGMW